MTEECKNCRFSRPLDWDRAPQGYVSCRHGSPAIVPELLDTENDAMTWGFWPHVAADQWCGEWLPK